MDPFAGKGASAGLSATTRHEAERGAVLVLPPPAPQGSAAASEPSASESPDSGEDTASRHLHTHAVGRRYGVGQATRREADRGSPASEKDQLGRGLRCRSSPPLKPSLPAAARTRRRRPRARRRCPRCRPRPRWQHLQATSRCPPRPSPAASPSRATRRTSGPRSTTTSAWSTPTARVSGSWPEERAADVSALVSRREQNRLLRVENGRSGPAEHMGHERRGSGKVQLTSDTPKEPRNFWPSWSRDGTPSSAIRCSTPVGSGATPST